MLPSIDPISVIRRRYGTGSFDSSGVFQPGAYTETTLVVEVQQASSREIEILPEGVRHKESRRVYWPNNDIRTADQYGTAAADRFVIGGVVFVAMIANEFRLLNHDRVIVTRLQEGQS